MGSSSRQPFMYSSVQGDGDDRFPTQPFDPKAVTRSSYERKAPKPKPKGPLIAVNRHPDAHMVLTGRSNWVTMGQKTKAWIKGMRVVQLVLRVIEHVANLGLLILMILINNVEPLTGWVLRTTIAVAIVHCIYGIYHNSRPAGRRTPGSSSAYHVFAGVTDLTILPLYAYGCLSTRNQYGSGEDTEWGTLLNNKEVLPGLVAAVYYGLIGAGGLHLISLAISLYLGVMFRRISMMPPDMNPLESNLTARRHKKSKSSVATSVYADSEKRMSTPAERHPATINPEDVPRPRSMAFMHTREGSRDARMDLPSRQYQVSANNSPRNSTADAKLQRMSAPPRGSYTEVPLDDNGPSRSRPDSSHSGYKLPDDIVPSYLASAIRAKPTPPIGSNPSPAIGSTPSPAPGTPGAGRAPKFTEAWYASESLVNRTQERTRAMNAAAKRRTYQALDQRYDISPDSDSETENNDYSNPHHSRPTTNTTNSTAATTAHQEDDDPHPNPLRQHPTASSVYPELEFTSKYTTSEYASQPPDSIPPLSPITQRRPKTPFSRARNSILSAISLNDRRVSGSQDIADGGLKTLNRVSSITADSAFYSKPYGDLRPATPPVMIDGGANGHVGVGRQVSSGNDYDLGSSSNGMRGRHVSGKVVEEGRAGGRWRYETLDE
ncbi:hypothetical protein QBC34DRAFT_119059 [Podospora aff. communis PSN243]|uniref:Uncharacterized protein n=1 Tax=Podospora aff. communis PSN243 TaxID=3040156 RepID=A0AAV9GIE4_9PEZI|nr:hypothetical protein QBC34DRAFT_119059 [Podospora aff. communis PSN243]